MSKKPSLDDHLLYTPAVAGNGLGDRRQLDERQIVFHVGGNDSRVFEFDLLARIAFLNSYCELGTSANYVIVRYGDSARIDYAFRRALARSPRPAELDRLQEYLSEQRFFFESNPTAADELLGEGDLPVDSQVEAAAWTNLCSVLLNLHEFITRD